MNCIKRLGEQVMSRTFERQVNELHIRAAILNRFTELGRPQTAAVTQPRPGFGEARLKLDLCNSATLSPFSKSQKFEKLNQSFTVNFQCLLMGFFPVIFF
jgi:hypothetical protein